MPARVAEPRARATLTPACRATGRSSNAAGVDTSPPDSTVSNTSPGVGFDSAGRSPGPAAMDLAGEQWKLTEGAGFEPAADVQAVAPQAHAAQPNSGRQALQV